MSHFKQLKDKKGFTLVEVVIALAITGILVTSGVSFITPFIKLFFYAPEQLRTEYIGNQIVDSVIEGNHGIEGLDTAKMINFASQEVIIYTNNNDEVILLEWDPATGKIRRTLPSGQVQFLPIDTPNHQIKIAGSVTPEVIIKYLPGYTLKRIATRALVGGIKFNSIPHRQEDSHSKQ